MPNENSQRSPPARYSQRHCEKTRPTGRSAIIGLRYALYIKRNRIPQRKETRARKRCKDVAFSSFACVYIHRASGPRNSTLEGCPHFRSSSIGNCVRDVKRRLTAVSSPRSFAWLFFICRRRRSYGFPSSSCHCADTAFRIHRVSRIYYGLYRRLEKRVAFFVIGFLYRATLIAVFFSYTRNCDSLRFQHWL